MQTEKQAWIQRLAHQEDKLETKGEVSFQTFPSTSNEELEEHTVEFLKQLRVGFTQSVSLFNQMKGYIGSIRIYGISNTESDFMLFRNGYKLIFSMKGPGLIAIRFLNTQDVLPRSDSEQTPPAAQYVKGVWGAFGEMKWTHNEQAIKIDYLIRYFMTHFVKQSIR